MPKDDDPPAHAIGGEIRMVTDDLRWTVFFTAERNCLLELLPEHFAAIEHLGSTIVPGLAAGQPIVDILAGVSSLGAADALLEPLGANGYVTPVEFNATLPDRRWLVRHSFGRRTHHLHLMVFGGERWVRWLRYRDALRVEAAAAGGADAPQANAGSHTPARAAFIEEVLANVIA